MIKKKNDPRFVTYPTPELKWGLAELKKGQVTPQKRHKPPPGTKWPAQTGFPIAASNHFIPFKGEGNRGKWPLRVL